VGRAWGVKIVEGWLVGHVNASPGSDTEPNCFHKVVAQYPCGARQVHVRGWSRQSNTTMEPLAH
jgi:hypothetical protein